MTLRSLGILVGLIIHSVKLGSLVCAITVHLLLVLFKGHGNSEYVRALACVRACVCTCACDLSFRREASGTSLKTSIGRAGPDVKNPCPLAHDMDTQPITLATAVIDSALTSLTRKLCIL